MARYLLLSLTFILCSTMVFSQTSLQGKVTDVETGEPILFGTIAVYKNGELITGGETDFDGNYSINPLDPGTYDVEASYTGYTASRVTGVLVSAGKANKLDLQITEGILATEVVVTGYKVPLIEQDNTTQGSVVTAEQIRNLPTKSINGIAQATAGVGASDDGGALSIRGSRTENTIYYLDGIQVRGVIPQSEIEQLQVITGGLPASYGDVTGGIVSATSKGPSSKFSGGLELETSEFLDAFGYNLASANISGPIVKNSEGKSILGFRFSGQYIGRTDDDPPATPIYRVKDEKLTELQANPVIVTSAGIVPAAEFLTDEDVDALDYKPFEERTQLDLTAKIDARLSDAIDISLSGSLQQLDNYFTPFTNYEPYSFTNGGWRTLNSHNNPLSEDLTYRGNFRFRHRLGGGSYGTNADGEKKASLIQNASYTVQLGYERETSQFDDNRHGDDVFNYGYIGKFDYDWVPIVAQSEYTGGIPFGNTFFAHADYRQEFQGYTRSEINSVLANYNNVVDIDAINPNDPTGNVEFVMLNGQINGPVQSAWGYHANVGTVYNRLNKSDNDYYTLNINSTFDLVPNGSSENGRHSIQFGILYEQRFIRGYNIEPYTLWTLARQQANRHLSGVDTLNVIGTFEDPNFPGVEFEQFAPQSSEDEFATNYFFKRVRAIDGTPINEFFNVDAVDPSMLSLDMFSAQELNDFTDLGIRYYGYDFLGNKQSDNVTFDDFFNTTDENGVRTFPVASFQPIYASAFIQDKFTFKDIIFRLGLRVDRYDANTKVLKDPYSLYEIMNARDFYALSEVSGDQPSAVGDDFKVYVNGQGSNDVIGYRDGEQWYFADGSAANSGALVLGTSVVTPRYYEDGRVNDIKSTNFDVNNSFKDYEPQLNWMPRLAFSFPISEEANFFAHYDILVQRPSSAQARATAFDYYYMETRSSSTLYRNPNLRPQRTVDYEVGFKQKVSNTSAITIAAYYKELRDMIQRRPYVFVASPITSYTTYDNQDFGTVKGFSFTYDLRRTNNVQILANYTLQFADGTGSNADSQRGLTSRGNLRTLFPLDYDDRHNINVTFDYRYASGNTYNGPTIGGIDIFANTGLNIQANAVSGRPYTARILPQEFGGAGTLGSINGARKPWNYRVNLRIDKDFQLAKEGNGKRPLYLNVYFRAQNLLNTRNVINVYSATGSPTDDGYLTSANGQDALQQIINTQDRSEQAYLDAYNWVLVNPDLFSLPRRMYVGAIFSF